MSSNRVKRPFTYLKACTDTALARNVPDAQLGTQLSTHSKPTPTDRAGVQRFHWIWPSLPARNAALGTSGPLITNRPQHPNDIVAGRTTKLELASERNSRGGELAATEVAAAPHAITVIAAMKDAAFRIPG